MSDAVGWHTADGKPVEEAFDLFADWHGYYLHVEQMDIRDWWWMVTLPDGRRLDDGICDYVPHLSTRKLAMAVAEVVVRTHFDAAKRHAL